MCLVLWLVLGLARGPVLYLVLGSFLCLVLWLVLGSPSDGILEQALDRTVVPALAKARGAAEKLEVEEREAVEPEAVVVVVAATAAVALETLQTALHP